MRSGMQMDELAAYEPVLVAALAETAGVADPPAEAELLRAKLALERSELPEQQKLYNSSSQKAAAGRTFSFTVLTLGVSAAIIILALRLGYIRPGPDGNGWIVVWNSNNEPLSQSLKGVAELLMKLFSQLPPGDGSGPTGTASKL